MFSLSALTLFALYAILAVFVGFVAICLAQAIIEDIRDWPRQREQNARVRASIARINARNAGVSTDFAPDAHAPATTAQFTR